MKTSVTNSIRAVMVLMAVMLSSGMYAATFTAIASGNWSASTTWAGGNAPSFNIISDNIHIDGGFTVTLDNDVNFDGALSSLNVDGKLISDAGTKLIVNVGSITGNGIIQVSDITMNSASSIAFTGQVTADNFRTSMGSMLTSASFLVRNKLTLTSGVMSIQQNGQLQLGTDAVIEIATGSLSLNGGTFGFSNPYNVSYTSASVTTGPETSGSGLNNVYINVSEGNQVKMGNDMSLKGVLTLNSGNLMLNGHHLHLNGDIAATGTGSIFSDNASDISIVGSGNYTGSLRFAQGGNHVHDLNINMGSAGKYIKLGSDLYVDHAMTITSGNMQTGDYSLILAAAATMTSSSNDSYVMTGENGHLGIRLNAGDAARTFYVGNANGAAPVMIGLNSGSTSGTVMVNTAASVYDQGTTGNDMSATRAMVRNTWHVTSDIATNLDMSMEAMWSASMEANSFDRTRAYISHYTNGAWDMSTAASATAQANGMFSIKRDHINSLSPFAVMQSSSPTGITEINANDKFDVYPNPVADVINISNTETLKGNVHVEVMNQMGQLVQSRDLSSDALLAFNVRDLEKGNYFIRIYNNENVAVKKFIKL